MKAFNLIWRAMVVVLLLAAACTQSPTPSAVEPTFTAAAGTQVEPTRTPMPTPVPERTLVACLGKEPPTLFLYGGASDSMWSVLEAIYDGPFDTVAYQLQPVILESIPSVENEAVAFLPVPVVEGDIVVDASGSLVQLVAGTQVLPAGCSRADCAVAWSQGMELSMDQMQVRFTLLPDLAWSDGEPLTAQDLVYSYMVASDPALPLSRAQVDRTASYTALDERTAQWVGVPGYFPRDVSTVFWLPLPEHQLGGYPPAELINLPLSAETPLGWGPYVIQEWARGDHITLARNPNYFRAAEGLPAFDKLVFRFPGSSPFEYLDAIYSGECDVVDRTAGLSAIAHDVRIAEIDGKLNLYLEQGPAVTQLMIGQQPASYDDGYQVYQGDRPDFFSDVRMRQALALCLNREGVIHNVLYDMTGIPQSYVPTDHPLYAPVDSAITAQDTEAGKALLEAVGWTAGEDGKRFSRGVAGVPDGTELRLSLAVPQAELYHWMLEGYLAPSLADCGFAVDWQETTMLDLYAPGPEGLVFGRQFDLALITWFTGNDPACSLYLSDQIPAAGNYWVGVNAGGYASAAFDAACQSARQSRLDDLQTYVDGHTQAQRIFTEEQPAIPLYYAITAAASRLDLCGYELDASTRSDLWNLENWDVRDDCIPQE